MRLFSEVRERLRALLFRRREERELDEELGFHLEMEVEENLRRGLDPREARRLGALALGGVERTKEDVRDARGTRFLENSASDFAFALRTLRRSPGFAAVVILTLGIGIGGTTAVFSTVDAVLLRALPYEQPGRLVRLYQYRGAHPDQRGFVTPVHYLAYRDEVSALQATAAINTYDEQGADIGGAERPERIRVLPISSEYFAALGVLPQLGRGFRADEENGAPVVILSHRLWHRRFRTDPGVLGLTLSMSGTPHVIVGVMPAGFVDPLGGKIDAWTPLDLTPGRDPDNADNHYLTVLARLRPAISLTSAQAELDVLGAELNARYRDRITMGARLYPLKEDIVGSASLALTLMLGAVGLVLLLCCVNIANLLLVRGSERAREFAVRSALGAARGRLVRQLLVESLTLAVLGDLAGVVLARMAMPAIVALGAGSIPRLTDLGVDPRSLAFSAAIASLSAILFGLAPALRAARPGSGEVLRGESRTATGGKAQERLRAMLVVSQVALAFVLLCGSGLLLASFQRLRAVSLGVTIDRVLTFELNLPAARYDSSARARFYEEFARQVASLPGVRAAGGISKLPATGEFHEWGTSALTGPLANQERGNPAIQQRVVSGEYFRAAGIPILAGRAFDSRDDAASPYHLIVSEGVARRLFPGVDPIGHRLNAGGQSGEVIGIVPDVAVDAEGRREMHVYHPHSQFAGRLWALTQVVSVTGRPEALEPAIRRSLAQLDPELVMHRPMPLDAAIGLGRAQRAFTLWLLTSFAAVALALAGLGLFGVLSYTVRVRAREFGIRMALGAGGPAVRQMVMRQGLTVTALGIGIGLGGALALARVIRPLAFEISPLDPRLLAGAALFMAAVAGAAAYLPARRATAVDPRTVLQ